ncbi:syntaxin-22-like protein [Tanacetum coccineum]
MTLGYVFSLACIIEARFEAIAEKEQNIKEKAYTTLSLPSEEASLVVKGPLDASKDTILSLRSEDPNFKIQEKGVEYVRALNATPLEVVFAGPVDEVSSMIDDVFDISESNVESMQVRGKFAKFSEDKGSVEKVLSATKLPEGGNSHSAYSPYHLEGKVNFEGVGNVTPWAADVGRRKIVKCYLQGSGRRKRVLCYVQGNERRKRKKSVGRDNGRRDCALMGASIFALYNPGPGSLAQGRIWDPGIKSAFQDNTFTTSQTHVGTNKQYNRVCGKDPTQAIASGIFQINTSVATFQRLVNSLGTPKDTPDLRDKLHKTRLHIGQLVKDTSDKLKQLSEIDHRTEVSASKKITDAKLAKDFQAVLNEFQKAQRLSVERETAYSPAIPQAIHSSRNEASELDASSGTSPEQHALLVQSRRQSLYRSPKQEVLLLDNEVSFNEAIIEERDQGIQEIQNQIGEVNEVFKDLAVLVHEQGTMIDDIGSSIENSNAATAQGKSHLVKASKTQKSNSSMGVSAKVELLLF